MVALKAMRPRGNAQFKPPPSDRIVAPDAGSTDATRSPLGKRTCSVAQAAAQFFGNSTSPDTWVLAASYAIRHDTWPKCVGAFVVPTGFPLANYSRAVPRASCNPSPSSSTSASRRQRTTATGVQRCWRSPL